MSTNGTVDLALSLLIALLNNAAAISAQITKARSENRDLSVQELQALLDDYSVARAKLVLAIAEAKGA